MNLRVADLHCREVICMADGKKLGHVTDVTLDTDTGCVCALVITMPGDWKHPFQPPKEYLVPWKQVECIGEDSVLLKCCPQAEECPKKCRFL